MSAEATPYWVLISVLFSSIPLNEPLANALYQVAYELNQTGGGTGEINGDLAHGRVVNLRKDVLVGTMGGPSFEAELETERGKASVRFFLTRQGLTLRDEQAHRPRSSMMN